MMDVPLIFYFGPAILLGSAYYFLARPKMAASVKRGFHLYTAVDDLASLSERRDCPKISGTAVIIGGSLAGLMAALACSEHFEDVVIIEADEGADLEHPTTGVRTNANGLNVYSTRRKRIMQTYAVHNYQPFLLLAFRRWFPDWDERVVEQGGFVVPWDVNFHASGFRLSSPTAVYPHPDPSILPPHPNIPRERLPESFCLSRAKFEPLLRKLVVERRKNICIVNGLVTGFLRKGDDKNLAGVTYTTGSADTTEQTASLVVDCSGPAMVGLKALRRLVNSGAFQTSSYSPKIRYATVTFKVKEDIKDRLPIPGGYHTAGWFYTHISLGNIDRSIVFGAKIENDQIQIGFGGWGYTPNQIPHSADALIAFHESLGQVDGRPSPMWFTEVIKYLCADGGWEDSIYDECAMPNVTQVLYTKSESVPPNFIAIGDSVMQGNPVYGFGATKACVGAVTLAGLLAEIRSTEIPAPFALSFFRKQHLRTGWTWGGSKVADYVFDSTEPCAGEIKDREALPVVSWFRVCEKDPLAAASFLHARMFLYPATSVMPFRVMFKVLLHHYTGYLV